MRASQSDTLKVGFFDFSHALVLPLTYREPMRFDTMPSMSIQHA